ncbi:glycosyl transferase, partial [Russula vinacea]
GGANAQSRILLSRNATPIDRFLTFYYGHLCFHINNMLIILSVQLFIVTRLTLSVVVFLGTLNPQLTICKYLSTGQPLNGRGGCYNLHPVYNWVHHCIISILLVFMIAFLPLLLLGHENRSSVALAVRLRVSASSLCCSPQCLKYSPIKFTHSILNNLTFGGTRYIATGVTGHGFATSQI